MLGDGGDTDGDNDVIGDKYAGTDGDGDGDSDGTIDGLGMYDIFGLVDGTIDGILVLGFGEPGYRILDGFKDGDFGILSDGILLPGDLEWDFAGDMMPVILGTPYPDGLKP